MKSVHFQFGSQDEDAEEMTGIEDTMPNEVVFTNNTTDGVDELRLIYDYPAPISLYRSFLSSVYGFVGGYATQLRQPSWIRSVVDNRSETFDRKHTPIVRETEGQVEIAVVDYIDDLSEPVPIEWQANNANEIITVEVTGYIESVIDASREYIIMARDEEDIEPDERVLHFLEDAQSILSHLERTGELSSFKFDSDSPPIQEYLYESPFVDSSLSYYIVESGIIRDEIHRLQKQSEQASQRYKQLLSHKSEQIQAETATVLESNPDERANEWLLARRWTDIPEIVVPSLRAAANFQSEEVHTALLETLSFSEHAEIRRTAVELLKAYPNEKTVMRLEEIVEEDEDETVRETAQSVLNSI